MKRRFSKNTLYIGLDDSNHAGKRGGEIITAIFSKYYLDKQINVFPRERKKREYYEIKEWMNKTERDFRFTILTHKTLLKGAYNLPLVAPYLINDYLKKEKDIEKLYIYFDGKLEKSWEDILKRDFKKYQLMISNFTGPNKTKIPNVLGIADRFSNFIFREKLGSLDELLENSKMVPIDLSSDLFTKRKELFSN